MTISEAIKRLNQRIAWLNQWKDPEDLDDIKLGLEALKAVQRHRGNNDYNDYTYIAKLIGETEE